MDSQSRWTVLFVVNVILPVACLVFATGFFPYKPFISGLATYQTTSYGDHIPEAPFDKLVFMVVDALRSDFVFAQGSGFAFTQSLISSGSAIPFTAHATAPTVTMPRVKAITTGSIPSFLDMILNFAESDTTSSLAHQDTWLAQIKAKGGKLTMFGDDTWLKLFPDTFGRSDGTSSFFVSDFTEVDNNVTRHVPEELAKTDWTGMIMHYLGMDHIGHKSGSKSVHMLPKQREMDGIVKEIYGGLLEHDHLQSTLLVLCGDHGMTDGGNHGGSAPGETSPAVVFISPKFKGLRSYQSPASPRRDYEYYDVIEQSDIAPTLAGLLGFPVPQNNLGVFAPGLLELWNDRDKLQLLSRNAQQMLNIVKATFPHDGYVDDRVEAACDGSTADRLVCTWRAALSVESLLEFCKLAQQSLSSTASNYDLTRLYLGLGLASLVLVVCAVMAWPVLSLKSSTEGRFFVVAGLLYAIMMLASSYVEEEHQFWYWITSAWFMLDIRRWNQSGQKYQGADDIVSYLNDQPFLLWPLVLLTLQTLFTDISTISFHGVRVSTTVKRFAAALLVINCLLFKISYTAQQDPDQTAPLSRLVPWIDAIEPTSLARLLWLQLLLACLYVATSKRQTTATAAFAPLFALLLVLQTKLANIPAHLLHLSILYFLRQSTTPQSLLTRAVVTATDTVVLAHMAFYSLGGTNGIATIDLSNAYNGVGSYNPLLVGLLLVLSNWSAPLFWSLAARSRRISLGGMKGGGKTSGKLEGVKEQGMPVASQNGDGRLEGWRQELTLLTLWMAVEVTAVMLACVVHRQHLFVWTVFSPKFLYMAAWLVCWHIGANCVLSGLLVVAG